MDTVLTTQERSELRAKLLQHGIKTRGLSSEDMLAAYEKLQTAEKAPESADSTDSTHEKEEHQPHTPTEKPPAMTATDATVATDDPLARQIADLIRANAPKTPELDEARLIELIKQHATETINVTRADSLETKSITGAHKDFKRVLGWLSAGRKIYLCGPAGSGKTTIAMQAADALDLPFYSTGAIMAAYELLGFRDANGAYHPSALYEAYKNGGVFLFDELDASSAKAINAFNQLLDNEKFTFPDGVVEQHPDFRVIAGANTVGKGATRQYIGRQPLDGASMNRFVIVDISYDLQLEKRIAEAEYKAHGGMDLDIVHSWVDAVVTARRTLEQSGATAIISPRQSRDGAAGLAIGMKWSEVMHDTILNGLSDDQQTQVMQALA